MTPLIRGVASCQPNFGASGPLSSMIASPSDQNFGYAPEALTRYSGSLKYVHLYILAIWCYYVYSQNSPWNAATRYSVYWPVLAAPNYIVYTFITAVYDVLGVVLQIKLVEEHNNSYPRDRTAVITFEVGSFLSRGYFNQLAIPTKLHCHKGGRINCNCARFSHKSFVVE